MTAKTNPTPDAVDAALGRIKARADHASMVFETTSREDDAASVQAIVLDVDRALRQLRKVGETSPLRDDDKFEILNSLLDVKLAIACAEIRSEGA